MLKTMSFLTLIFITLSIFAFTQAELEDLRNDPNWLIGKGDSGSESKADRKAINDLLSQITVQVQTSFTDILTEENGSVEEYCSSIIETYSSARLDAAERSIFEDGENYIVYRFIKKTDRDKIFAEREKLIKDYARRGAEAEKELRIGDALMNYYWSLILLRTHPDWDKINEDFDKIHETLITYLPDRIRRIFSLLDLKITSKRYDMNDELSLLNLEVTFKNKAVNNLDIKYYLGSDWSVPVGVSQGKALLEFLCKLEDVPNTIKINVMYNDDYKASHNSDLRKVIEEVSCPVFRECRFEINLDENYFNKEDIDIKINTLNTTIKTKDLKNQIDSICEAISYNDLSYISEFITENGRDNFRKIINYGNAKLIVEKPNLTIDKINDKTYIRGLPVQFNFPNSSRKFSEELVFILDENNKIEEINFALSSTAVKDIIGKVKATDYEKFQIVNFIEQYKTAYCTKNIDFIEKVFDDNALIIVGQILKNDDTNIEGMYNKLGRRWKAVKYSKTDYIRNLVSLFASNEYVNLHFENNVVTRVNSDTTKVFGVQIHQYYYSQKYSDEGYLFLMFDLTHQDKPKIYVRTWQPEKNPDGTIFGLDDFYLPNN